MYKIILAVRYLIKRRITYLAVLAVALCTFMVVVVMTVMTGLVRNFKIKNHNWVGDCVVSSDSLVGFAYYEEFVQILEREDCVEAVSPVIRSYALLTYKWSGHNESVELMGIEPSSHCRVTDFGSTLHFHREDCSEVFEPVHNRNLPGGVLGTNLVVTRENFDSYRERKIPLDFSFSVSCFPLTAKGGLAKAGVGLVNNKTFYFSDDSLSGLARVDGSFVYLPFEDAQVLCGMELGRKRVNAIHIKFKPAVELERGCDKVKGLWKQFVEKKRDTRQANLLENVRVESWKSYRRETIAPMEKEQVMMTAVFVLIGVITVFIVFVIFYMMVNHKVKDIGILKSVGVAKVDIIKLFLYFAFLVGVVGTGLGAVAGWGFLAHINQIENWLFEHFEFQLWDRTVYAIGDIPNEVEFRVLVVIMLSAILACLAGAVVPSWQGAKLEPIETLQVGRL